MARSNEVLEFFGSTPVRLVMLERLTAGPEARADLLDTTDVSRITLWRLLGDLEERGWIRETGDGYEATAAGRLVVDRITTTVDAIEAIAELGDLLEWLPLAEISFDVERLADADVVRPTKSDPQAPMRVATRQMEDATTVRILTHGYSPWVVETLHDRVVAGETTVSMVVSPDVLEAFAANAPIRDQLGEMIEAGGQELYRYGGPVPHIFAILDRARVGMGVDDDEGRPQAVFDIVDDEILDWAERTHERYREEATPVDPGRFRA